MIFLYVIDYVSLFWCLFCPPYFQVHQIYSVIGRHKLKPNSETFRSMINLCVKMKDVSLCCCLLKYISWQSCNIEVEQYRTPTYRISFSLQYEGAYSMLSDLEKMNLAPTAAMYNAIMTGYFREVTGSWSYEIRSVFVFLVHILLIFSLSSSFIYTFAIFISQTKWASYAHASSLFASYYVFLIVYGLELWYLTRFSAC